MLRLHEVTRPSVDSDIRLFFQIQLTGITKNRSDFNLPEEWPSSADLDTLCAKAASLFIYASTVVRFVASKDHQPSERLADIVTLPQSTFEEGRSGLDQLYTEVLQQAFLNIPTDDEGFFSRFKSVVGAVMLLFNPLSVSALSELLGTSDVSTSLRSLHSLIIIPISQLDPTPLHVLHKSFSDFLTDPQRQRCIDQKLFIDPLILHRGTMPPCPRLMKERLRRNICQLDVLDPLSEDKDLSAQRAANIGDALEYACCFWASYLVKVITSGPDDEVFRAIDEFFTTCFLFWVEVLSLVRNLGIGIHALNDVDKWYMMVSYIAWKGLSMFMLI